MLSAIAYAVAAIFTHFPSPLAFSFLRYDPKDVIILLGGFLYGPIAALSVSVVVSLIEMVTVSPEGPFGLLMNIVSTCSLVLPATIIYSKRKTLGGAAIGLAVGIVSVTGVMALFNYMIVPLYSPVPREVVAGMLLPVFVPFNLFKGITNAVLTIVLFKPLATALLKAKLIEPAIVGTRSTKIKWVFVIAGLVAITVIFLLFGEFSTPPKST
jgi:riboflavin transporter FmnP